MTASPLLPATGAPPVHLTAERSHTFVVARPCAETFPLFEPMGEKKWAEGWQPRFLRPTDGTLGDDTVFTTARTHGADAQILWLITRYEPAAGAIDYRSVLPGVRVARILVQCRALGADETSVAVGYRYTGLSPEGDQYIAAMTVPAFRAMIDGWAQAIREYFVRGTPASP